MKNVVSFLLAFFLLPALALAAPLTVEIVSNSGYIVTNPTVPFGALTFSFTSQQSGGVLGTLAGTGQRVYILAPANTPAWSVSLAATNGPQTLWRSATNVTYDFNDPSGSADGPDTDTAGGQLRWLGGGIVRGLPNESKCPTTNINIGGLTYFQENTVNSITILSTTNSGTTKACDWDYYSTLNNLGQVVPAGQRTDTYTLQMTLTIL